MPKRVPHLNRDRQCAKCTQTFIVRWDASPQRFCSRICAKEETYKKVSAKQRGRVSPLIGRSRPAIVIEKIRRANLGRKVSLSSRVKMRLAKLGRPSPKRGIPLSPETKAKLSLSLKGRHSPMKGRPSSYRGSRHHNWKGGITPINERIRHSIPYKEWRTAVFARDDYTCQLCKDHGGTLHADHIKPFAYFPYLRFDVNNGRTLCVSCHLTTPTHGYGSTRLYAT